MPPGVDRFAALSAREAAAGVAPDAIRRLAALIPPAQAESVGARLKQSNADRKRLMAAGLGAGDEGPRALAYRFGPAVAIDRLLLADADPLPVIDWVPPRFPLSGGALVALGLSKGPEVAAALKTIETQWIGEGFPDAARVDQIATDVVAAVLARAKA